MTHPDSIPSPQKKKPWFYDANINNRPYNLFILILLLFAGAFLILYSAFPDDLFLNFCRDFSMNFSILLGMAIGSYVIMIIKNQEYEPQSQIIRLIIGVFSIGLLLFFFFKTFPYRWDASTPEEYTFYIVLNLLFGVGIGLLVGIAARYGNAIEEFFQKKKE